MKITNKDTKIGYQGESYSREIKFEVSNDLFDCDIYFEFEKPDGNSYVSERINPQANYLIPLALLDQVGFLKVQMVAYRGGDFVKKSEIQTFYISKSLNAVESLLTDEGNRGFFKEIIAITKELGAKLSVDENGVISLLNKDGEIVSQIDLPTEKIIKNVYYDESSNSLVFEFENANSVYVPMATSIDKNTNLEFNDLKLRGFVNSNLTPSENKKYNLGSKTNFWKNAFAKEIVGDKYRVNTGEIDSETGEPIFSTFLKYDSGDTKLQHNAKTVAQFGSGYFYLLDGQGTKVLAKESDGGDVKLYYKDGTEAIVISENSGEMTLNSASGNRIIEIADYGTFGVWNKGGKKIIDTESANYKINIIPESTDNAAYVDVQGYDRIKFGGDENTRLDDTGNLYTEPTILAYKKANSPDEVVPFAITREGKVYYQGKEIGGSTLNLENLEETLNISTKNGGIRIVSSYDDDGGSILLKAQGDNDAYINISAGYGDGNNSLITMYGVVNANGILLNNNKKVLTEDDLGDIEAILDRLNGEV